MAPPPCAFDGSFEGPRKCPDRPVEALADEKNQFPCKNRRTNEFLQPLCKFQVMQAFDGDDLKIRAKLSSSWTTCNAHLFRPNWYYLRAPPRAIKHFKPQGGDGRRCWERQSGKWCLRLSRIAREWFFVIYWNDGSLFKHDEFGNGLLQVMMVSKLCIGRQVFLVLKDNADRFVAVCGALVCTTKFPGRKIQEDFFLRK
jgi:hypothetical protein